MQFRLFKHKKTLITSALSVVLFFGFSNPVYALDCSIGTSLSSGAPELSQLACPIMRALNVAVLSSGAIFVAMIFLTAYKYAMSQGDPKGLQGAKTTLTYAIVGFVALLGLYTFSGMLGRMLGAADILTVPKIFQGLIDGLNSIENLRDDLR